MPSPSTPITITSTPNGANHATRPDIYAELAQLRHDLMTVRDELEAVKTGRITKNWYTRSEAAEYLRISVRKLHDLRASGRLSAHVIDGRPVFHVNDLDSLAERDATGQVA